MAWDLGPIGGTWTDVPSGTTFNATGQTPLLSCDSSGDPVQVNLDPRPFNGQIQVVKLTGSTVANSVLVSAPGADTIEHLNNPGTFGEDASLTLPGQVVAWKYDAPTRRWKFFHFLTNTAVSTFDVFANRPDPLIAGSRFAASDGSVEFVANGTSWQPLIEGRPGNQPPKVASFTAEGTMVTFFDSNGTIQGIIGNTGSDTLGAIVMPRPVGGGIMVHMRFAAIGNPGDSTGAGIITMDSVSGKAAVILAETSDTGPSLIKVQNWDTLSSLNATIFEVGDTGQRWFWYEEQGGVEHYRVSPDGLLWIDLLNQPTGTFVPGGGDTVGLVGMSQSRGMAVWDSVLVQ